MQLSYKFFEMNLLRQFLLIYYKNNQLQIYYFKLQLQLIVRLKLFDNQVFEFNFSLEKVELVKYIRWTLINLINFSYIKFNFG